MSCRTSFIHKIGPAGLLRQGLPRYELASSHQVILLYTLGIHYKSSVAKLGPRGYVCQHLGLLFCEMCPQGTNFDIFVFHVLKYPDACELLRQHSMPE